MWTRSSSTKQILTDKTMRHGMSVPLDGMYLDIYKYDILCTNTVSYFVTGTIVPYYFLLLLHSSCAFTTTLFSKCIYEAFMTIFFYYKSPHNIFSLTRIRHTYIIIFTLLYSTGPLTMDN